MSKRRQSPAMTRTQPGATVSRSGRGTGAGRKATTRGPGKAGERPGRRAVRAPAKAAPRPRGGAQPVRDVLLSPASLLAFVRAGGTVPLLTWIDLPPEIQAALERAGTKVRAEFALAVAAATRSPEGAEAVAEAADDGLAGDEIAVHRALEKARGLLTRVAPAAGTGAA